VIDENGCSTCECNPPPASCGELGENDCNARADCVAEYGGVCDAAPCPPGDEGCFRAPCEPSFLGCRERGPCEGLDEQSCTADPQCEPIYQWAVCDAAPCSPDDPSCFRAPCDPIGTYAGCQLRDRCAALDEQACLSDPTCEPIYADVLCDAGFRAPCPAQYAGCHTPGFCGNE
jgi:hypothetical protein